MALWLEARVAGQVLQTLLSNPSDGEVVANTRTIVVEGNGQILNAF